MIYADYAATTFLDREVAEKMNKYNFEIFGNATSVHNFGRSAAEAVENARRDIAKIINAEKNEIYFTSGGTESDNWALTGAVKKGDHIIISAVEHHAVLKTAQALERMGIEVSVAPVDNQGVVITKRLEELIKANTRLLSVMTVNNEVGSIQPIEEIGALAKKHNVLFHTDAVQAIGKMTIDVKKLNISMLSASAHKFFGPKGTGFLYINENVKMDNLMFGGSQERDRRPGTINTPGIVGMAEALKKQYSQLDESIEKIKKNADIIKNEVLKLKNVKLNCENSISILSFSFENVNIDNLLFKLDLAGIECSAGAACSAGAVSESHVLKAMHSDSKFSNRALRVSISQYTTEEEAKTIGEKIVEIVSNN